MKMYANCASSSLNQLSMLFGDAHSSHRCRAQFRHFRFGRHEFFPPSKKCSRIHTKSRKIRSCWHQLCGHFSIAETKYVHLPRSIRYRWSFQQRRKHWLTSNGLTPLMLCNPEAMAKHGINGHHQQKEKSK